MASKGDRRSNAETSAEVARSYSELLTKLRSQVGFLERSSALFDEGNEDEGERLALGARVLLHDTDHSHSLLGQLRVKTALSYTDTSIHNERERRHLGGNLHSETITKHAGLVGFQTTATGSWTYAPVLRPEGEGRVNPPAAFDQWWRKPFLKDTSDRPITRRSVVLDVANKDGGAHVAKAIPEAFRLLTSGESLPFQVGSEDGSSADIPGIVMATMRQIAFELLDTLHRDLPNFILGSPLAASAHLTASERAGISRNSLCPCESGKKFKACHGS
jgi:SEC-C motif